MKKPSIQRNVILSTLYQILTMVTPLITAPYTARVLGADGVGINSYTTSINTYFLLLAVLGTSTYGCREIARNRENKQRRSQIFWEIEILTAITTGICLLAWAFVTAAGGAYKPYLMVQTISLAAVAFEISWFYAGMERFDYTVYINTVIRILTIICIFVFVKEPEHLGRFMVIFSLGNLLGNLSMWIFLPEYIQKPDFKNLQIWQHFKKTLIYFVPTIATSVYTVLDKTLIGLITQEHAQNGYYEQATKIINMAKSIAFVALNGVLTSRMSYLYAEHKEEEIRQRTDASMEYMSFMCVGLTFGIFAVAPRFVMSFFGPEYMAVVSLLQIFSPIILIIGISNCVASHYFTPVGLQKQNATFLIVGACVNLMLNCILIPYWGSHGAAFASVIAELAITILYVSQSQGFMTAGRLMGYLWKKLVAAAAMVGAILLIDGLFPRPLFATVCEVALGVGIYCVTLLLLRDRSVTIVVNGVMAKLKRN